MISYHKIDKNDNPAVAGMIRTVMREFKIDRPGTVYTDPSTDHLYELFQTPGACYFVAKDNDVIIGGCGIFPTDGLPNGWAELVKYYLLAEYRGLGIGKELMNQCIDWARNSNYKNLYLESMPELSKAVGIYEKIGFKKLPHAMGNSGHFSCNIFMELLL